MPTIVTRISRRHNTSVMFFYDCKAGNVSTQHFIQEPFARLYSFETIYGGGLVDYSIYINWLHNQLYLGIRKDILFYKNNLVEFEILKNFHKVFDNNKDNTLYNNIKYIEDNYVRTPLLIEFYYLEPERLHTSLSEENRLGQLRLSGPSILFDKLQFLTAMEQLHFYEQYHSYWH